jgi:hypothetical protein
LHKYVLATQALSSFSEHRLCDVKKDNLIHQESWSLNRSRNLINAWCGAAASHDIFSFPSRSKTAHNAAKEEKKDPVYPRRFASSRAILAHRLLRPSTLPAVWSRCRPQGIVCAGRSKDKKYHDRRLLTKSA